MLTRMLLQEGRLLEEVAMQHADCYDFSSGSQEAKFDPLFMALVRGFIHAECMTAFLGAPGPLSRVLAWRRCVPVQPQQL